MGLHGLCFGFCFAGPLPLRSLLHGPLSRVHFGESLVVRLYSKIDHIHLSSEAQCVSHHLPQVDCHTDGFTNLNNVRIRVIGWFCQDGMFGFPVEKKICTPQNTFLCHYFVKLLFHFKTNFFVLPVSVIFPLKYLIYISFKLHG